MDKIFIASDHAGFELKSQLISQATSVEFIDLGTDSPESVDYPDFAEKLAKKLKEHPGGIGCLVCGSGQGMAIKANRYSHIRAALCYSVPVTKLAREHNNANVLCLGARFATLEQAAEILNTFISTEFEGGRHAGRVDKLS